MTEAGKFADLSVSASRYERLELVGTGSFGEVYRGWDREAGYEVAIKVIDLENVEDDITDIHREVAALAECRSSNITEYYASVMLPGTTELLIVMELMAGSVSDLLDDEGSLLDESSIAFILREVLKALVYLHDGHRIHRDVKSANVLLSAHGEVKISDFGVSGQLSKTVAFKRKTFVGSPFWMAPEVIRANTGGDGYTETADIWSLGISAYEMATGRPPHADLHPMRALFLIPAEDAPRLEGPFSQEFKSFIAQCLQKDPALRPSAKGLLAHPFLAGPHDSGKLAELVQRHAEKRREAQMLGGRGLKADAAENAEPSRWDFGTVAAKPLSDLTPRGSIKSHQINSFTIRDTTWGDALAQRQLQQGAPAFDGGTVSIAAEDNVFGNVAAQPEPTGLPAREAGMPPPDPVPGSSTVRLEAGGPVMSDPRGGRGLRARRAGRDSTMATAGRRQPPSDPGAPTQASATAFRGAASNRVLLRLFNASSSSGNDLEYENSGARPDGRPADENAISNTLAEVLQLLSNSGQEIDLLSPAISKSPSRAGSQATQSLPDDLGSLGNFLMARGRYDDRQSLPRIQIAAKSSAIEFQPAQVEAKCG